MIDVYIQNSNKQSYFTPGIRRFEDNLVNQLKKIRNQGESTETVSDLSFKSGRITTVSQSTIRNQLRPHNKDIDYYES